MFNGGSDASRLLTAFTVPYGLALIAVVLRLFARRIARTHFWWDDWLAVCALVACTGSLVGYIYCIKFGLGRPTTTLDSSSVSALLETVFVLNFGFLISLLFVKCSILAFFIRVFNVGKVCLQVYLIGGLVAVGTCSYVIASLLRCIPLRALWDSTVPGQCFDGVSFDVAQAGASLFTCLWILGLFQYIIWSLHLRRSQKVLLTGVFLIGCFVCFVACIRLWALATLDRTSTDPTQAYTTVLTWTSTEPNVALICACLPSLGPIFVRLKRRNSHSRSSQRSFAKEPRNLCGDMHSSCKDSAVESMAELSTNSSIPTMTEQKMSSEQHSLDSSQKVGLPLLSDAEVGTDVV